VAYKQKNVKHMQLKIVDYLAVAGRGAKLSLETGTYHLEERKVYGRSRSSTEICHS